MKALQVLPTFLLIASCLGSPLTAPPERRSVVHERRNPAHHLQWTKRDRMPATDIFEMRIGLAQPNTHRGYEFLMDVSDPKSPNYGQHWAPQQIAETFAPSDDTVSAAKEWLVGAGIDDERIGHSPGGGWLVIHPTVEKAEELLQTEFWVYEHEEGSLAAGVDEYSIPSDLTEHIEFVYPAVVLGELKAAATVIKKRTKAPSAKRQISGNTTCSELVTPDCIAALYNIPPADKAHPNNSMGIFEKGSWYQNPDLDMFFANYAPAIPQGTRPQNLSIDQESWFYDYNDTTLTQPDEADLDLDVAYPLIYPQNITVFQVDDVYNTNYNANLLGIFNTFLDALDGSYCNYSAYGETGDNPKFDAIYPDNNKAVTPEHPEGFDPGTYKLPTMCGTYKPTNVISMSYGRAESSFTEAYMRRQCDEFMKLGLQGISVVVASGDTGPLADLSCRIFNLRSFWVQSASNCPYVTSVGATQLLPDGTEKGVQTDDWASSGGFSRYFAGPEYQQSAVATYIADHNPVNISTLFNSSNRGVPDIAAVGHEIAVAVNGELTTAEGTSASAPLFAALLNRVNEERLAVGKGPVGFVNPVLYANPGIFQDVISGNNGVCDTEGFDAVEGWDPVTGLGTPDYPKLLETFMALP